MTVNHIKTKLVANTFFFHSHHMSFVDFVVLPPWAWQECNRRLSLGLP